MWPKRIAFGDGWVDMEFKDYAIMFIAPYKDKEVYYWQWIAYKEHWWSKKRWWGI